MPLFSINLNKRKEEKVKYEVKKGRDDEDRLAMCSLLYIDFMSHKSLNNSCLCARLLGITVS